MEELKEWNYKVGIKLNIVLRKKYTIFKYGKMGKIFRNVGGYLCNFLFKKIQYAFNLIPTQSRSSSHTNWPRRMCFTDLQFVNVFLLCSTMDKLVALS